MKNKDVWLFPQNSCNIEQFLITLNVFGKLNGISRNTNIQQLLMEEQKKQGHYNPYIKKDHHDLSSANHKIDEPRFYGAIYETPNKKIHVSSYGELILKYENDIEKRNKVFVGMLCNIQFNNPYKKMQGFNIYPLRLIFNLLCDKRLNYYLTNLEIASILYFIKTVKNVDYYNKVVDKIIEFRNFETSKVIEILITDSDQIVKNYVSCNYLFNMLCELGIAIQIENGNQRFRIQSHVRKKPTIITPRIIKIKKEMFSFVERCNKNISLYEKIKFPSSLRSDWLRDIYNSVPQFILSEISEEDDFYTEYLQIPKILVETSVDPNKWNIFEKYITKSFNLFEDVEAETIGGAGQPDSLCKFVTDGTIFCADGKSTHKKLSSINDGRLKQHRMLYNAKYTIIVTPGYVPSAVEDIKGTDTCIITSYCFADLITKYIFKLYKNKEECSYEIFNDLVLNNLGTDLSEKIYKIIDERLGVSIDEL